jgi:hypothetical protein
MPEGPYNFECDLASALQPDPNEHARVGFVTALNGLGLSKPLAADLEVFAPTFTPSPAYAGVSPAPAGPGSTLSKLSVVGIIGNFTWPGSAGSPIQLDFYSSQENASQIAAALKDHTTTSVQELAWWICDYDPATKVWYEQSYPAGPPIAGVVPGAGDLTVNLNAVPATEGASVHRVTISVAPTGTDRFLLMFARTSQLRAPAVWGPASPAPDPAPSLPDPAPGIPNPGSGIPDPTSRLPVGDPDLGLDVWNVKDAVYPPAVSPVELPPNPSLRGAGGA